MTDNHEVSPLSSSFPKGWLEQSDYPAKKETSKVPVEQKSLKQPDNRPLWEKILGFLGHWPGSKPQEPMEETKALYNLPNPGDTNSKVA